MGLDRRARRVADLRRRLREDGAVRVRFGSVALPRAIDVVATGERYLDPACLAFRITCRLAPEAPAR